MLLAVRAASLPAISVERTKNSEKMAVASVMRYIAPAILAACRGGHASERSVMLRDMAYAIRHRKPIDMTPSIKSMAAGCRDPGNDE
jgi:hypothetical protein